MLARTPSSVQSTPRTLYSDPSRRPSVQHGSKIDTSRGTSVSSHRLNSHGAALAPWIAALPAPVRAVVMMLYGEMLRPDDDFPAHMRKSVLAASVLLVLPLVGVTLYNIFSLQERSDYASILVRMSALPYFVGWVGVFGYARATGDGSAVVGDLWLTATECGILLSALLTTDFQAHWAAYGTAVIAMLLHTPRIVAHMLALFAIAAIAFYNDALYGRVPPADAGVDAPLLMVPDPVLRTYETRLVLDGSLLGAAVVVLAALFLYTHESAHARRKAADLMLAREVSRHLGRYDTMAAKELLAEAEAALTAAVVAADEATSEAVADEELLATLRGLTGNLDKFRPHIPAWLIERVREEEEEEEALAAAASAESGAVTPGILSRLEAIDSQNDEDADLAHDLSTVAGGSTASGSVGDIQRTGSDPSMRPSPRTPKSPYVGQSSHILGSGRGATGGGLVFGKSDSGALYRNSPRAPVVAVKTSAAHKAFLAPGALAVRPGAVARVSFRTLPAYTALANAHHGSGTNPLGSNGTKHRTALVDALHALVDAAHDLAHVGKGVIHSFVGDEMVVSWNAASRAVQHEAKALRFLWRLRAAMCQAAPDVLRVTGAAFTGQMQVLLAGQQSNSQGLTLSTRWHAALDTLFRAAQEAGTVFAERQMHASASYACRARLVAALRVPDWSDGAHEFSFGVPKPTEPATPLALPPASPASARLDKSPSRRPSLPASVKQVVSDDDIAGGGHAGTDDGTRTIGVVELTGEVDDTKGEWMYVLRRNNNTNGEEEEGEAEARRRRRSGADDEAQSAWSCVTGAVEDVLRGTLVAPTVAMRVRNLADNSATQGWFGDRPSLRWALATLAPMIAPRDGGNPV
eukprot:CAMPEP_0174879606 /NCGR_PEP_ID=MMETSP1114-20130205/83347_1 /TAXON_ID=312471 /ORGANISM="Neobodo designis, Strain CCAP 1951/1" /LENGTH=862 /DNA_ID=CAMNT_0016115001 /DNA_START=275 /DNA_END=2863 /DNA_ORIENTATION=+